MEFLFMAQWKVRDGLTKKKRRYLEMAGSRGCLSFIIVRGTHTTTTTTTTSTMLPSHQKQAVLYMFYVRDAANQRPQRKDQNESSCDVILTPTTME
mmetsp:Transcript_33686/g.37872  ORF Transcript_33686/g.37872 Transcript_33686/m.37872 type:complete len:96 (+) Transcript_33686:57-344(+)